MSDNLLHMNHTTLTPYQAWLHWDPTTQCNLACSYCFTRTNKADTIYPRESSFTLRSLWPHRNKHTKTPIPAIDIDKALKTLDTTNKIFRVSFTGGGEPFLVPNLAEFCGILVEKHFVSFNTNLTSPQISLLAKKVPHTKLIYIVASLHIHELQKKNLLNTYIKNYHLCKDAGFDMRTNEVAHPALKKEVSSLKRKMNRNGITLNFDPFIGYFQGKKYPEAYTPEEIELFGLQIIKENSSFFHQGNQICNAGYNIAYIDNTGTIYQCPGIYRKIGHIYEGLTFDTALTTCTKDFCACPMKNYDQALFEKAVLETNKTIRQE